jgi:hypothetical protein
MKRIYLLLFATTSTVFAFTQETDGDELFNDNILHEIRFENADTNVFIDTKDYQQLNMYIDNNLIENVGFKRKGNISGYSTTNKYGIKIKTNKYVSGTEYDGAKEFTLHMNFQDPSMLREKLTYDLCNDLGLYSLRTAFAKVYINDVYWGVYTLVEGKDEMYKQLFDNRGMDAIESLDFGNMCYVSNDPSEYDYDNNGGWPRYQLEGGDGVTAWPMFADMIDDVNNTSDVDYLNVAGESLNLEDFFRYQAANVYLMNMDSYIGFQGNQIYVYDTLEKIWQVTPWDFNASFGLWDTNNEDPASYSMIPNTISNGCVASKMNDIPELKTYYLDGMCELHNALSDTTTYFSRIDFFKNLIKDAVYDDSRKVISDQDFDDATEYGTLSLFGEDIPSLKRFINLRNDVISAGFVTESYSCDPTLTITEDEMIEISIFPNPVVSNLNIVGLQKDASMKVFNLTGQQVLEVGVSQNVLDVSSLDKGIYFLKIYSRGNGLTTKRFLKQ